jgi:hypothetical protein
MKLKLIKAICWLLLLITSSGFSQSAADDLNKYWAYRSRFLGTDGYGGFISIGSDQGQSIPASMRNIDCDCLRDWALINAKIERHKGNGLIKWGDATVHLGYYLAMLSMEYKNLVDAKADTRATVKELYYALKAFERLDKMAEVALGLEPELNGFFLRDDVPVDFYKESKLPNGRRFPHQEKGGYDCVSSDYCKGDRAVDGGSFVSQDQAASLLFGFAFVKKFAGDAIYEEESSEKMGDYAKLYTHLIVSYMTENSWRLKSPDGQKISNRWGGDVRAFSTLFASAANSITEGMFDYIYHEKVLIGRLVKGSYSWAFGLHNDANYAMIFSLMMISDQWSSNQMGKRTKKADMIFFALADAVLNDRKLSGGIKKEDFETMIKTAPLTGPCFGTPDCQAPDGWKSSQIWFHTNQKNGNPYGQVFEYPGVDFMLIYNLYHYYYNTDVPIYKIIKQNPKYQKKPDTKEENVKAKAFGH